MHDVRLGKDWPAISHLSYWREQEVDEFLMNMLASFKNYMYVTFKQRWNVRPTRIQLLIGSWLEGTLSTEESQHLRGVMAYRSATKTAITSNFSTWLILRDPRISIKVVAGKDDLAKQIIKECRVWFDVVDFLKEILHPSLNYGTAAMQDNYEKFNVPGNPGGKDSTFSAVAIQGNLTGSRAHIVIMDDVEHPANCDTAPKREKLKNWDSEANNIIFDEKACAASGILFPGFKPFKIYLGTPHHEESLYYYKMNQGYKFRIWPARYPNAEFMKTIGPYVDPELLEDIAKDPSLATGYGVDFKQGRIIDPDRQSEAGILQKEIEGGPSGFAKQYMLDVSLQAADQYPLKVKDLIVADLDSKSARGSYLSEREPQFAINNLPCVGLPGDMFYRPSYLSDAVYDYETIVMSIDPSGRGKDETAYAIVAVLNGNYFLLEVSGYGGSGDGYSDEVLNNLALKAKEYQVKKIIVETNFGDGVFAKLLTPFLMKHYPCNIEEERASTQKEIRIIETMEPVISRRKLIVSSKAISLDYNSVPEAAMDIYKPTYRFIYQLSRITRSRNSLAHDDRIDAVEAAIRYLIDSLALDQDKQEDKKFIDDLYDRLNNPIGISFSIGGSEESSGNWLN